MSLRPENVNRSAGNTALIRAVSRELQRGRSNLLLGPPLNKPRSADDWVRKAEKDALSRRARTCQRDAARTNGGVRRTDQELAGHAARQGLNRRTRRGRLRPPPKPDGRTGGTR